MLDWLLQPTAVAATAAAVATLLGLQVGRRRLAALRAANERLARQVAEQTAATQARSRFLAMMSHEIRTPLTGIVGFADVLEEEPLSDAGRRSLDAIRRSSRALQALLGDILDFSRIDAGALPMQRCPVDLEALLLEVRDEFAPQARRRGLAFGLSVAQDARRWSETDPLRLRQVVVNLVSNAIRYTEAGMVQVTAAADPANLDVMVIRVADTGLGIAPEDCERIFDAFAQAADGESRRGGDGGGVGLGLAIANGLVTALQGSLALESTVGQGSVFTVRLTLPPCAPGAPAIAPPVRSLPATPARVLLVDDVAMNRELFTALLSREGHHVTAVEDGEAALRCLEAARFDLALIDIQMPFMDGLELTRHIRAAIDPVTARLPIVALSAAAYGEDRERARAAGMDGYVTKPATRDDIADAIARVRALRGTNLPPDPSQALDAVVVDLGVLDEQRATFGAERLRRFLALLRDELSRRRTALEAAAHEGDRAGLALHAHAVASAAGNLGFNTLLELGRRMESEFPDLADAEIPAALDRLYAAIDAATGTITALDAELANGRVGKLAAG